MKDKRLKELLKRAANEPAFMEQLKTNREDTVDELDLSDSEKAMLKSIPISQLETMVEKTQSVWNKPVSVTAGAGCLLGGAVLAAGMMLPTLGHTSERAQDIHAASHLKLLGHAQAMYKEEYSCYADIDNLRLKEPKLFEHFEERDYTVKVTLLEDGFLITAIHKNKPNKRKSFKVGTDLKVEVIPD